MSEHKNDTLGARILIAVIAILITVILSISITAARTADAKANTNTISVAKVETSQSFILLDVREIKRDVKDIRDAVVK